MANVTPIPPDGEKLEKLAEVVKRIDGEEEGIYDLPEHPKVIEYMTFQNTLK